MNEKDLDAYCTDIHAYLARHGCAGDKRAMLKHLHKATRHTFWHWLWRHPVRFWRALVQFFRGLEVRRG